MHSPMSAKARLYRATKGGEGPRQALAADGGQTPSFPMEEGAGLRRIGASGIMVWFCHLDFRDGALARHPDSRRDSHWSLWSGPPGLHSPAPYCSLEARDTQFSKCH